MVYGDLWKISPSLERTMIYERHQEVYGKVKGGIIIEILDAKERASPSSVAEMSFKYSKNPFLERKRLRKETKEGIKA